MKKALNNPSFCVLNESQATKQCFLIKKNTLSTVKRLLNYTQTFNKLLKGRLEVLSCLFKIKVCDSCNQKKYQFHSLVHV